MDKYNVPVLVSWSGGKDSAMALHHILKSYDGPVELFTTINSLSNRVAMHGFPIDLLDRQAESLGLPIHKIPIPDPCSNDEYSKIMEEFTKQMKERHINTIVFGDLFLEDIRKYREDNLTKAGISPLFPLWQIPTPNLALNFIRQGFKAVLTCVDTQVLSSDFAGRVFNMDMLGDLPATVDPCGENGEFHTFVFDGPIFKFPVDYNVGSKVIKYNRFCYIDLISK